MFRNAEDSQWQCKKVDEVPASKTNIKVDLVWDKKNCLLAIVVANLIIKDNGECLNHPGQC